jgi:DNA-3-methyladenine glycosylase II
MPETRDVNDLTVASISPVQPYDFALSRRASASFRPGSPAAEASLRLADRIGGRPVLVEIAADPARPGALLATSRPGCDAAQLHSAAAWVLFAVLDLAPFYRLLAGHPRLDPLARKLFGLKPMRPDSLFEMFVTAITEQQISLTAAYAIRGRLIERFGEPLGDRWVFPGPAALAAAETDDLRSCGLSRQKAEYIRNVASRIAAGEFDPDSLKSMSDDAARDAILGLKGFGGWSADYILVRGLARTDCVPAADLGIQDVVGEYLGDGARLTAAGVEAALEPFRPFRGLLAFYLLAAHRLDRLPSL